MLRLTVCCYLRYRIVHERIALEGAGLRLFLLRRADVEEVRVVDVVFGQEAVLRIEHLAAAAEGLLLEHELGALHPLLVWDIGKVREVIGLLAGLVGGLGGAFAHLMVVAHVPVVPVPAVEPKRREVMVLLSPDDVRGQEDGAVGAYLELREVEVHVDGHDAGVTRELGVIDGDVSEFGMVRHGLGGYGTDGCGLGRQAHAEHRC